MAAALSSAAIVFNKSDSAYSQQLLSAASSLYVQVRGLTCINCSVCVTTATSLCGQALTQSNPAKAPSPAASHDSAAWRA